MKPLSDTWPFANSLIVIRLRQSAVSVVLQSGVAWTYEAEDGGESLFDGVREYDDSYGDDDEGDSQTVLQRKVFLEDKCANEDCRDRFHRSEY